MDQDLWIDINGDECDDAGMALYGWSPVQEHPPVSHLTKDVIEPLRQVTLEQLESAYAWAEKTTEGNPSRPGDLMIQRIDSEAYSVYRTGSGTPSGDCFRVLSRAPQPKPWQGLAEVLEDYYCRPIMPRGEVDEVGELEAQRAAQWMYGRGIRLTGDAE